MKKGFLLNGLVELLAGIYLYFNTSFLIIGGTDVQAVVKLYGLLATIFGGISLVIWKNHVYSHANKLIYLFVMAFHMMVAFYFFGLAQTGLVENPGASITHLIIFIILLLLYFKDLNIKTVEKT